MPTPLPAHHHRARWQWWFLLVATTAILILGLTAFHQYGVIGAFDHTIQLFTFSVATTPPGWEEKIARWLAAAVALVSIWTVLIGVWRVYLAEFHYFLIGFGRNHVVVCGIGWRGLPLAREFRFPPTAPGTPPEERKKENVLVIEKSPDAPGLLACQRWGVPYLVDDATDPRVLRAARVHKARILIIVGDKDSSNLEIAIRTRQLLEKERRPGEPLHCYLHLADPDLRALARHQTLFAGAKGVMTISTVGIDLYENGARWLFQHHPLDWRPIEPGSPRQAHLIIVGLGEAGESVLVQAARIGHFANGRRLRVTVVDPHAAAKEALLQDHYPEIGQTCDLFFHPLEAGETATVALLKKAAEDENAVLTCAITAGEDASNLALALKYAGVLRPGHCALRVYLSFRSGLALLLSEDRQSEIFGDQIRPFGMMEDICNRANLERSELDALAHSLHEAYVAGQQKKGDQRQTNSTLVSWEDLSEDLKASNRHAADHIAVKLRAVGRTMAASPEAAAHIATFSDAEIEVLSQMEHNRFCAERFLAGWRCDPRPKDPIAKTSPTLIPWEDLSEAEREKDREQVRSIPHILAKAGWLVSPPPAR